MSHIRPALRTSLVPCLALFVVLALSARRLAAQDLDDAEKKEAAIVIARADSARATLVQPPGSKGLTPATLVRAPFRAVGAGLALVAGAGYGVYRVLDKTGTIRFVNQANRDLRANDIRVRLKTIGSRSGLALLGRWDGARPLFVEGGISMRRYSLARAGLAFGDTLNGVELAAGFHRKAQLHFWGIGNDSREVDVSDYEHTMREATVRGQVRVLPHVRVGGGAGWEEDRADRGNDAMAPDVQDVFAGALPFGAVGTHRFMRADADLDLDFTSVGGPFQLRGVRLVTDWSGFRGVDEGDPDFQIASTDLRVYLPLNSRHAFALRGYAADAFGESNGAVPIYYLATVGGSEGLRGQKGYRLRDRAALIGMAEWRYQVWWHPGDPIYRVDAFAFVDHGAVGSSLGSIESSDFLTTPGIGIRFVNRGLTSVETFLAFGGDATPRIGFKLGASF